MVENITQPLRGVLKHDELMSKHTSWRVGGPADHYYQPADLVDLCNYLSQLPESESVNYVGLGSNLLVRDGGIRGVVIATSGVLNQLESLGGSFVRAEAGVSCAKVARFCARNGMAGSEFLAGIPGTMGGALAMNAGAFGGETWDIVHKLESIARNGEIVVRDSSEYQVAYRSVKSKFLADEWFVAAHLRLASGDKDHSLAKIKELLAKRGDSQPTQLPNAGSVFRNPEKDYAARLIEVSGLKGISIGGASVSNKHANFIINNGSASASDIEALIEKVQLTVQQEQGVSLSREVHIMGEV